MGSTIEEEIIKNQIPIPIYNFIKIMEFLLISFFLIIFLYSYTEYYENYGIMKEKENNYYLKVKVLVDDLNILKSNNKLFIDNSAYNYEVFDFDNELLVDINKNNYKYLYLKVDIPNNYKISNYIVKFKVEEGKKRIYEYLINVIGGNNNVWNK